MTASFRNDVGPIDVNVPKIFVPSVPCPTNLPETPAAVMSAVKLPAQVTVAVVSVNFPKRSPMPVVRSRFRFASRLNVPVRSPVTAVV